ncbi:MAG TPA: hypothetical protein VF441_09505 [Acidimicrobiia bacterium]
MTTAGGPDGTAGAQPFGGTAVGTVLGPLELTVSEQANERYWSAAGLDHPALRAGALYPPIAGNLTILLFQTVAERPMLQTTQHLVCHRRADAGVALTVDGVVAERYEKRGRQYAVVEAIIALADGSPVWTSRATFTEVAR